MQTLTERLIDLGRTEQSDVDEALRGEGFALRPGRLAATAAVWRVEGPVGADVRIGREVFHPQSVFTTRLGVTRAVWRFPDGFLRGHGQMRVEAVDAEGRAIEMLPRDGWGFRGVRVADVAAISRVPFECVRGIAKVREGKAKFSGDRPKRLPPTEQAFAALESVALRVRFARALCASVCWDEQLYSVQDARQHLRDSGEPFIAAQQGGSSPESLQLLTSVQGPSGSTLNINNLILEPTADDRTIGRAHWNFDPPLDPEEVAFGCFVGKNDVETMIGANSIESAWRGLVFSPEFCA